MTPSFPALTEPRHGYAMAASEVERLHASLGNLLPDADRPL